MVDYLDVPLNFNDDTYRLFHKYNNDQTIYIHVESDHSSQTIKKTARSIEKRLSHLFSPIRNFKIFCEQLLRHCGYNEKLNYTKENNKINQKFCQRKILWFNRPYSKSEKTNIGKLFLRLIKKHFHPTHKYRKLFNRNTIIISY